MYSRRSQVIVTATTTVVVVVSYPVTTMFAEQEIINIPNNAELRTVEERPRGWSYALCRRGKRAERAEIGLIVCKTTGKGLFQISFLFLDFLGKFLTEILKSTFEYKFTD